jgi:DNA (cytosine-5)-methyltransferase 1
MSTRIHGSASRTGVPDRNASQEHQPRLAVVRQPTARTNGSGAPRGRGYMSTRIVDLFAGAGGWEEGLRLLGSYDSVGIESDPMACRTAEAAGHRRRSLDVAAAEPSAFGEVWGLIASPPCQAYSLAGKGLGRVDQERVVACARELAVGDDTRAAHGAACRDRRSLLTVEPLRWALALRPAWIALEQVPPVLGLWSLFAELLEAHGYRCATGVLSAERYGVAQTRRRAFLIASRHESVALPAPSHRSFNFRRPDEELAAEAGLARWVSLADALGWDDDRGMSYTNCQTNGGRRPRGLVRSIDCPARTVDTSVGAWSIERHDRCERRHRGDRRLDHHERRHTVCPDSLGSARRLRARPSRPACGQTARCAARCRVGSEEVRLSVAEAAVLQGFPAGYPWQGSRSRQLRQVGNAVCPPLAARVLAEAMRPSLDGGGAS